MEGVSLRDILTSVSILIALVTFVVGYLEKRAAERRQRTLDFLLCVMEDGGPIHQAALPFAIWIASGRVMAGDSLDEDDDKTVLTLLDFYDLISDAARRGVVDPEMIIFHLGGRMRAAHEMVGGYIVARRERLGPPGLYQSFERFVTRRIRDRDV